MLNKLTKKPNGKWNKKKFSYRIGGGVNHSCRYKEVDERWSPLEKLLY